MSLLLFFAGTGFGPNRNRHDSDGVWRKIRKRQFDEQQAAFDDALRRKAVLHEQLMRSFHPLVDETKEYEPLPIVAERAAPNVTQLAKTIVEVGEQGRRKRIELDQEEEDALLAMILKDIG